MPSRSLARYFKRIRLHVCTLLLAGAATASSAELAIPTRLQWNANYGYCGETSFICAGLYYGQYCSQYTARQLAAPNARQSSESSQLLLGVNDEQAAKAMHLSVTPWKPSSSSTAKDFLVWVETQILAGRPAIIGVFTNENLFYGSTSASAGDPDYDHIVPVVKVSATAATYNAADSLTISDNGLWDPSGPPAYLFTYRLGDFQKTRQQANDPHGLVYSLKSNGTNYGTAVNGVLDLNRDTIPVRVTASPNTELPAMKDKSNNPPAAGSVALTVTVTIPDQTVEYNLYRYDNFSKVPDKQFNANAGKAATRWRITRKVGSTFVVNLTIPSNQTAVFRAVRTSAP